MVKPSKNQSAELVALRDFVIEVMMAMEVWSEQQLTSLIAVSYTHLTLPTTPYV